MQEAYVVFPTGFWGIDHKWSNLHWALSPNFQILVANGQLGTPKSTIELKFEVGNKEIHKIFIVMENLTGPIFGRMFLQRNHTVLDMRQSILNLPFFSMQLKTVDHR